MTGAEFLAVVVPLGAFSAFVAYAWRQSEQPQLIKTEAGRSVVPEAAPQNQPRMADSTSGAAIRLPQDRAISFQSLKFGETQSEVLASLSKYEVIRQEDAVLALEGPTASEPSVILAFFTPLSGLLKQIMLSIGADNYEALRNKHTRFCAILVEKYGEADEVMEPGSTELEMTLLERGGGVGRTWKLGNGVIRCFIRPHPLTGNVTLIIDYQSDVYFRMAQSEEEGDIRQSVGEV